MGPRSVTTPGGEGKGPWDTATRGGKPLLVTEGTGWRASSNDDVWLAGYRARPWCVDALSGRARRLKTPGCRRAHVGPVLPRAGHAPPSGAGGRHPGTFRGWD